MPALSSHGGNLSSLLSRDLPFTFLVIMGAMGCTWLKYFSKEHGLNSWTLWLILYPGCSAVVSAITCMYTVSHHTLPAVCGCSLQRHTVHAGCPVISHTGLAAPAHRQPSLPPSLLPDARSFTACKSPTPAWLHSPAIFTALLQDQTSPCPKF